MIRLGEEGMRRWEDYTKWVRMWVDKVRGL